MKYFHRLCKSKLLALIEKIKLETEIVCFFLNSIKKNTFFQLKNINWVRLIGKHFSIANFYFYSITVTEVKQKHKSILKAY
jgi:hypothetical protein